MEAIKAWALCLGEKSFARLRAENTYKQELTEWSASVSCARCAECKFQLERSPRDECHKPTIRRETREERLREAREARRQTISMYSSNETANLGASSELLIQGHRSSPLLSRRLLKSAQFAQVQRRSERRWDDSHDVKQIILLKTADSRLSADMCRDVMDSHGETDI